VKKCKSCYSTIQGSVKSNPSVSKLTKLRDNGFLKYGSKDLFDLLSHAQELFIAADEKDALFEPDAFDQLLKEVV